MINIREANKTDHPDIVAFQLKMAKETENLDLDPDLVNKGVMAVFDDYCKGTYYVAESAQELIASMLLTREWSDWRNGWVLWFQSVYVVAGHRSKGVFKKMYLFIREKVNNSADLKGLRLYVDQTNLPANRVYQALGMSAEHYRMFEWMKE